MPMIGDDNFPPRRDLLEQAGQVGFGLMNVYRHFGLSLVLFKRFVKEACYFSQILDPFSRPGFSLPTVTPDNGAWLRLHKDGL